jgi:antitoxin component YwqK of YwqJK toxin-antitoxin module|tara:strand:- start:51 stop:410 length:360 start_codon:yes stop_codon:yes gene_type:complete
MKKILSILLVSVLLIGCSEDRVLIDVLINKGTEESSLMYSEKGLFNGIGYDVFSDGQLKLEENFKDGKRNGEYKKWYDNGKLIMVINYKDGELDGLFKKWDENGRIIGEKNYKDGKVIY